MITKLPNVELTAAAGADGVVRPLTMDDLAGNRSLFNETVITERTPLIEINSALGLSVLRDVVAITNTGAVTNGGGENALSTGTTTASTASLITAEQGRYYPGTSAQLGIGVRAPGDYTGTAFAEWGYFGTADGFGFGTDATGAYVFYTRNSVQTKVYQADWNLDKLNGTGLSGATFDKANGNIFQITFSWYGYGVIEWAIVVTTSTGKQLPVTVHRFRPTTANSIQNPNQPIAAKVDNGNTTTDYTIYVGGRQFSVYGRYVPAIRSTLESRLSVTDVGTTFLPLITFRRKAGFLNYPAEFKSVNIITTADLLWEIRLGGSLTESSFGSVTNIPATETALEVDVAATAITGGQKIEAGLVSTTGSGASTRGGFSSDKYQLELPGATLITLCARAVSGTATVSSVLGMEEEW
jgi:hypothetical protein